MLKNAQKQVDHWIKQYEDEYWNPHAILARLIEEVGELAREINAKFGPKVKKSSEDKQEIADELGDLIFTICCLANSQKIDLDRAFGKAMDKCHHRDNNRFKKKGNQ